MDAMRARFSAPAGGAFLYDGLCSCRPFRAQVLVGLCLAAASTNAASSASALAFHV